MSIKYGSDNVFKDLGFNDADSLDLKFKAELYVILKKAMAKQKLTGRQLEKIWDVPQPRVSEIVTGKLEKISVSRLLNFLALLGVQVHPVVQKRKHA